MKKITISAIIFLGVFSISLAQETKMEIVNSDSTETIYCLIVGTKFINKLTVTIDMGEEKGFLGFNTSYILDEKTGKGKKFNSMVDAMNFMGKRGWDFCQAYAITMGSTNVYHYLLNQKVKVDQDGKYYPLTKKAFPVEQVQKDK